MRNRICLSVCSEISISFARRSALVWHRGKTPVPLFLFQFHPKCNHLIGWWYWSPPVNFIKLHPVDGGENTPDLCFASPEEILQWQRPRCATGNRMNHHCGDESILRANVTRDPELPCPGKATPMGLAMRWGLGLGDRPWWLSVSLCW